MLPLLLVAALHQPLALDTPLADPAPQASAKETPAERLLRQAQQLRYSQRWYEAAAAYRQFLAQFPTSDRAPLARFYLAASLERDQRWDEGAAAYTEFLQKHPEQRALGKEAKLSRITCWGMRRGQWSQADQGLREALQDSEPEVRVKAALELSRSADRRAIPALKEGLSLPAYADRCTMALVAFGEKPEQTGPQKARFIVLRIREQGKDTTVDVRLSLVMARAMANYLSEDQLRQLQKKGIHVDDLATTIANMPKGSLLFSVDDQKTSVTVTVE